MHCGDSCRRCNDLVGWKLFGGLIGIIYLLFTKKNVPGEMKFNFLGGKNSIFERKWIQEQFTVDLLGSELKGKKNASGIFT